MKNKIEQYLTFDDVLIKPAYSEVLPNAVNTQTNLTRNISLGVPLISAAMDTVTESRLAIVMAQNGGIGCIHKNMTIKQQAAEVAKVKKFESGMVVDPITITADQTLSDALRIMKQEEISGIPVVESSSKKLVGIITNRDVRFATDQNKKVSEIMTKSNLVTVQENVDQGEAKSLLHKHKIEKLLVVDANFACVGLVTVKDIEKAKKYPNASKDSQGRLRVAAAVGAGEEALKRSAALYDAGVDVVVVDT